VDDDGIWLGAPEGDETGTFGDPGATYGSAVSIEDLLSQEAAKPQSEVPDPPSAAAEPSWRDEPPFGSAFEIDRGFDPEWSRPHEPETRAAAPAPAPAPPEMRAEPEEELAAAPLDPSDVPIAPFPLPTADDDEDAAEDVLLTEVASGDDLFNDPSLEIARLAPGEAREIIVPVMLGEGVSARRYKLAIRLRLEPVE
jgi:hypothetical protein